MMTHYGKHSKLRISFLFLVLFITLSSYAQPETITFRAKDKVPITADLYAPHAANSPMIILFHQAKFSRGEYLETAPKLNAMGFNCLAVDLRSGGDVNGVKNATFNYADSLQLETRYTDAYGDFRTTVSYIKRNYPNAKIILFGSSYTASLAIKYSGDSPDRISGVVAFSPGEYFSKFGWARDIVAQSAARVKCPVFITSSREEKESWQKIYAALPGVKKVSFTPKANGKHGSKALWEDFPENTEYWAALKKYLLQFK